MCPQIFHNHLLCLRTDISILINAIQQILGANIGSQNNDGILKVYGFSHRVGDPSVIQYLKQYMEYIRMSFFHSHQTVPHSMVSV